MKIAYFDCFSGASGDMIVGSLVNAGLDYLSLVEEFKKIPLPPYELSFKTVQRGGLAGTKFDLYSAPLKDKSLPPHTDKNRRQALNRSGSGQGRSHHGSYTFKDLLNMVHSSTLKDITKEKVLEVLTRIGKAEARVHNTSLEEVEFHELGALDTILDIVGSVVALETLGIERAYSSPLPAGSGFVEGEHGKLPLPAPATVELLKGRKIITTGIAQELTTPTGAAILTTLTEESEMCPDLRLEKVGYGAGSRENAECPNLLRVLIGELVSTMESSDCVAGINPLTQSMDSKEEEEVWMMETNLDDMTGQLCGYVTDKLFKAGALEVYTTPIQMKKNRPGILLSALVPEAARPGVEMVFFQETTTFGIRAYRVARKKLQRMPSEVDTPYGRVKVKVGWLNGQVRRVAPEYEDCRRIAEERGIPLRLVYQSAMEAGLKRITD